MRQNNRKLYGLAQGAMIAAIYVALTMVFAPISFGPVQFRIARRFAYCRSLRRQPCPDYLCGCLLSNLLCGAMPLDVVFGSLATLIGAAGSWYLRKHKWCVCIPPIMANTIIIPWVLRYAYGSEDMILMAMVTVGIGEILAIGVLGNTLLIILERYKNLVFRQQAA
ncbi:MAG: QueT transporter family protein [Enterocloster clostridioformis]